LSVRYTPGGRFESDSGREENRRHWANAANAGELSANSANSPEVGRILHNRKPYEVANNSRAHSTSSTLSKGVVGTGSQLQIQNDAGRASAEWTTEPQTSRVGPAEAASSRLRAW
jgi:hypothetical protein